MSQPEWEHIKQCKSCGANIVFLKTRTGKYMPCDAASVLHDDYEFDSKRHISHFSTCPQANTHRRR